jgi:HEAT repeat protein
MSMTSRDFGWAAVLGFVLVSSGCGASEARLDSTERGDPIDSAQPPPTARSKSAERIEFASVDAAFAEVERLASDPSAGRQRMQVERWFQDQGVRIAPELAAKLADGEANAASRMAACRVLARLGPTARPALLAASEGPPGPVRIKAIESLARLEPADAETVAKLIAFIDDDDRDVRRAALAGLKHVGPPAKEASTRLQAILSDANEEETIRAAAKEALKSVAPRRTLVDQ